MVSFWMPPFPFFRDRDMPSEEDKHDLILFVICGFVHRARSSAHWGSQRRDTLLALCKLSATRECTHAQTATGSTQTKTNRTKMKNRAFRTEYTREIHKIDGKSTW